MWPPVRRLAGRQDADCLHAQEAQTKEYPPTKWRHLSGKEQTDALFDTEIIARMGQDLYDQVFDPAI